MALSTDTLAGLRDELGECHRCPLGDTRTTLVFGHGNPDATVMLVGEAPGRNEDLTGQPFVGAAGKLLDELLAHAGLVREDVYIANILKCRPPGNRNPKLVEVETCTPFLAAQIQLVDPELVVTLGNFATRLMLDTREGITTLRGQVALVQGRCVYPVFHPAASIYDRAKRETLISDFARLPDILDSLKGGDAE
ncbi:MAG: uracil-DNA glycosylase [Coriobacteriia bacterium]|nr:uracil-DNA glycosylase [Coriobacteriia bacterium]MDO9107575.1 uracil-DNA glycosylase [Coriobacteriia bacterium]